MRSGSITREIAYTADWHAGDNGSGQPGSVSYVPPCVANQALFCISDFSQDNGGTMLVPGSVSQAPNFRGPQNPRPRPTCPDYPD